MISINFDKLRSWPASLALAFYLLTSGPTVNAAALHDAASAGDLPRIEDLLSVGADVDMRDEEGATPLMIALLRGRSAAAQLLMERSADLNARDDKGWTPLHWAIVYGGLQISIENARMLIDAGADIDAETDSGYSVFHYAVMRGWQEIALELLDRGVKVTQLPSIKSRLLKLLAGRGYNIVLARVIALGFDVNDSDHYGVTPLMATVFPRLSETARLLIDAGADVNARNNFGGRALDLAEMYGFQEMADLLKAHGAKD